MQVNDDGGDGEVSDPGTEAYEVRWHNGVLIHERDEGGGRMR